MKLQFAISKTPDAQTIKAALAKRYGGRGSDGEPDVIVAVGGDGFMLETLRSSPGIPVFGINAGHVGFLMNEFDPTKDDLKAVIEKAEKVTLKPLRVSLEDAAGNTRAMSGFNDATLFRQTGQSAKLRIVVDGEVRIDELSCDGVIVSTPAGSTAYNSSAGGPVLPVNANLVALTPICPFRPRKWRGALLPSSSVIEVEVLEKDKRPVMATADSIEARDVSRATIRLAKSKAKHATVLFSDKHNRYIQEMFA